MGDFESVIFQNPVCDEYAKVRFSHVQAASPWKKLIRKRRFHSDRKFFASAILPQIFF
jgi:hypothetical protein